MSNKQVNAPTHVQGIDAIEPKSEEADNLVNIKVCVIARPLSFLNFDDGMHESHKTLLIILLCF